MNVEEAIRVRKRYEILTASQQARVLARYTGLTVLQFANLPDRERRHWFFKIAYDEDQLMGIAEAVERIMREENVA